MDQPSKPPSKARRRIASAIWRLQSAGSVVFVSELKRVLRYASEGGLTPTLKAMAKHGLIEIQGGGNHGKSRVVALTTKGRQTFGIGLPLLGSIPAGKLEEALGSADFLVDQGQLLPWKEGDFLLKVRGDSMIGDGILDGDKVLLRPNVQFRSGEIAAVEVGDGYEATLKHVVRAQQHNGFILRASNPKYPDILVRDGHFRIAGVFCGLIRVPKRGN